MAQASFKPESIKQLYLIIDATNACQLNCRYCYYGKKGKRVTNVPKVFQGVVNFHQALFPHVTHINFHYMGGEPLLAWEQILQLNQLGREWFENQGVDFSWGLTSNLIALDEAKAEIMIKEGANIHCSIDGPAEIQNRNRPYRNGKPSYQDVVKKVPLALQITPDDTARVTVCPDNADSLPFISETLFGLGFKQVGLFPAYRMAWTEEDCNIWAESLLLAFQQTSKDGQKTLRTILNKKQGLPENTFSYCGAGKGLWAFDVDGNLYHCLHLTNNLSYTIVDAVNNKPQQIRQAVFNSKLAPKSVNVPQACSDCPAKFHCNGGCWAENLLSNGDSQLQEQDACKLRISTYSAIHEYLPANDSSLLEQEVIKSCCQYCYAIPLPCRDCGRCESCLMCQTGVCHSCAGGCMSSGG